MTVEVQSPSGATPPQNLEAEAAVLGAVMVSSDAMERVVDILKPESFYHPRNGYVFRAAQELFKQNEPVDSITVRAQLVKTGGLELSGGPEYLATLEAGAGIPANVESHARRIEEAAVRRGLLLAATRIQELGMNPGLEVDAALDAAEKEIFRLASDRTTDDAVPLSTSLGEYWDQIERLHEDPDSAIGVKSGFFQLDEMTGGFQPSSLVILAARPSVGKALALDTPIPTPTGWTTMGALRTGNQVFDDQGKACTVTMATPVMYDRSCYEVVLSDGERIIADHDHQWFVRTRAARKRRGGGVVVTTGEMAQSVRKGARLNYSIATCGPLEYLETHYLLDPYVLGAWLGDGTTTNATITVGDPELVDQLVAAGAPIRSRTVAAGKTPQVSLSASRGGGGISKLLTTEVLDIRAQRAAGRTVAAIAEDFGVSSGNVSLLANGHTWADPSRQVLVQAVLRNLGVLGRKHIPRGYLEGSVSQRLALLQGLMDTDGTIGARGDAEFVTTNRELAEGTLELVRSLGLKPAWREDRARLNGVDRGPRYRIGFLPNDLPVFRLKRKLRRQHHVAKRSSSRERRITEIREVPSVPVRCIQVDSPSHLYLAGRACVPTHNTSLALNMAQHVAVKEKVPVAVFSLEMSRYDLTSRLLCAEASVNSRLVRTGKLSETDWQKIANAMGTLSEGQIYIDDRPTLTALELRARARRLKIKHNIGMVVIDYIQLMYGNGRAENRNQEVSEISRSLKALARELEIPVVALSQLNRSPEQRGDHKPQLSDLRESGAIEQDADLVMFIYREGLHNDEVNRNKAELVVAKHRNGPIGEVPLLFLEDQTRFVNTTRQSPQGPQG